MKKLVSLLVGILLLVPSVYGKDYTFECRYKTRKYLATELGISMLQSGADQQIAQAFLDHYNRADFKVSIRINSDGLVLYDGDLLTIDQAKDHIDEMRTVGKQPIVLFVMATYQKKSEKGLNKLMKSVYQLIEYREENDVAYKSYPVLCTDISMGLEVHALDMASVPSPPPPPPAPIELVLADNVEEEEISLESQSPNAPQQSEVERDKEMVEALVQEEDISTAPVLGDYVVVVSSSLSVRESPSGKGKKIASLTNGQRVQVMGISNGWAKIYYMDQVCYVKADYLQKYDSPAVDTDHRFMYSVYKVLYRFMPYVILLLSVLIWILKDKYSMTLSFLLGFAGLLFAVGNSEVNISAIPWFCDPGKVGWIMTIVNFILLCFVLLIQYSTYQAVMGAFRLGCVAYVLSFPLMAAVGIALSSCLIDISYFWAPIVAFALLWVLIKWKLELDAMGALRRALWLGVTLGGFFAFFLQTFGVLMLGGLIVVLISAFAGGKSHSGGESSSGGHSSGRIEYSADGTPYVSHFDGTTTTLHDAGGGTLHDDSGRTWHRSSNGNGAHL